MARKVGNAKNNTIIGTVDPDQLIGLGGNDKLFGGDGNDVLKGGAGNDRLFGGSGDDNLSGGTGNDRLVAGADSDTLKGGKGKDKFIFGEFDDGDSPGHNETITIKDFTKGQDKMVMNYVTLFTFDDLFIERIGNDTFIASPDGNNGDIKLAGFTQTLTASDFTFI